MNTEEQIIEKIRKLMRLAQSTNEHEANLAAQRAQELMLKHGIESLPLEQKQIEIDSELLVAPVARMPQWKLLLAAVVAETNGCRAISSRDYKPTGGGRERAAYRRSVVLIGNKQKLRAVVYFYSLLEREIERFVMLSPYKDRSRSKAYRFGLIDTLHLRLKATFERVNAETHGAALLVVEREAAAIQAMIDEAKMREKKIEGPVSTARMRGQIDGHKIALNKGLEPGAATLALPEGV